MTAPRHRPDDRPLVRACDMEADPAVLAAACGRHGVGRPGELFADVQHLVAPIVGVMDLDGEHGYRFERLSLVLALARTDEKRRTTDAETVLQQIAQTWNAHRPGTDDFAGAVYGILRTAGRL